MKNQNKTFKQGTPMFRMILLAMIALIIIDILLLTSIIFGSGIIDYLNQNAKDILREKVTGRKNYLENEMINNWSNLDFTVHSINNKFKEMIEEGTINIADVGRCSVSAAPFLNNIIDDLILGLRKARVTGIFIILNNCDLSIEVEDKPGLYIRDYDPISSPSIKNDDLLIIRGPVSVIQKSGIPMHSKWIPLFSFENAYKDFFYEPFQAAYNNTKSEIEYYDFGYWSKPYKITDDSMEVIAYAVPLILDDGTVYGVLGIDLTFDYLGKMLPYDELAENRMGSYIIAANDSADLQFENIYINGPVFSQNIMGQNNETELVPDSDSGYHIYNNSEFFCHVDYLKLYNKNTSFADQKWALIGTVRTQNLFAFSNGVISSLLYSILLALIVGIAGCYLISLYISKPVDIMTKDLDKHITDEKVKLHRTGIREIDMLAFSVEELSGKLIDASTKFSHILEMASVRIGGFEINRKEDSLFITDTFFDVFCVHGIDTKKLNIGSFEAILSSFEKYQRTFDDENDNMIDEIIYKMPVDGNEYVYIKYKYVDDGSRRIGLIEDVTKPIREKEKIEHERDYDFLTELMNRRAFLKAMDKLFHSEQDNLKNAALIMLDLDNLKQINDTYGHEYGDKYIVAAANAFKRTLPENSIISRISGDEFYIFYYGFDTKDEISDLLSKLRDSIKTSSIVLPNDEIFYISASGGVSWYPDDSYLYEDLLKYSDFAMYKTKQSIKGDMKNFDIEVYYHDLYIIQNKTELNKLIKEQLVTYSFQPIINAVDGELYAYEMLMCPLSDIFNSPYDVLTLARHEKRLKDIETLTFVKTFEVYDIKFTNGEISDDIKIFINTIASQIADEDQLNIIESKYKHHFKNIVIELTEEEEADDYTLQFKKNLVIKWNSMLALDDYGSGYNSEVKLLSLSPNFIKIDLEIIRDIDKNTDKQKIVQNVVSYAHERNMKIIAEGIETIKELEKVISMDVDYLQGYIISKPNKVPPVIDSKLKSIVKTLHTKYKGNL